MTDASTLKGKKPKSILELQIRRIQVHPTLCKKRERQYTPHVFTEQEIYMLMTHSLL